MIGRFSDSSLPLAPSRIFDFIQWYIASFHYDLQQRALLPDYTAFPFDRENFGTKSWCKVIYFWQLLANKNGKSFPKKYFFYFVNLKSLLLCFIVYSQNSDVWYHLTWSYESFRPGEIVENVSFCKLWMSVKWLRMKHLLHFLCIKAQKDFENRRNSFSFVYFVTFLCDI